ncbi:triose-phosphate transporter family protein [Nitzschia inconspicua]|uniref:Triose-phosphate transporter family protein n=1 Tax=Nitzschia inconspicua TaxID=303405 RepID=A0A9K3K965_9STRA|nr:triose-phosphate transporter family protein [Nitzschia inconspicua]KAG7359398.1 triose-phosphate transporter family protein [Nitzschia inconspicua]
MMEPMETTTIDVLPHEMNDRMEDSFQESILASSSSLTSTYSDATETSTRSRIGNNHRKISGEEYPQDNGEKDTEQHQSHGKQPSMMTQFWKNTLLSILQLSNIFLWYYTNGMNGIAMESFANHFKKATLQELTSLSNAASWSVLIKETMSVLTTTCYVTSRQLLVGAAIGRVLLFLMNPSITWERIRSSHWTPLSILHALGSLATNLGFMYGKASVIQVLKLLEPFETLILSQLFFREGTFTVGIVSSMVVVVGGAMSLLRLQSKPPAAQAVIAALASGLLLSCRNVLQRKHQTQHLQQSTSKVGSETLPLQNAPPVKSELTKVEKSVVQFTQLSFYSGVMIGLCYIPLLLLTDCSLGKNQPGKLCNIDADIQVYLWHPLYNIFSMITLGFCSALTHSLLNAGKRVFAICMAMVWFHEGLNDPAKLTGLLVVAFGGCWYSAESKAAKSKK